MTSQIASGVIFFGQRAVLICDGKCNKAWGVSQRPKQQLSDDEDDVVWLADDELGEAPADPGTYEGGEGKPCHAYNRHNKWCARECERSRLVAEGCPFELKDFSKREFNMPWR